MRLPVFIGGPCHGLKLPEMPTDHPALKMPDPNPDPEDDVRITTYFRMAAHLRGGRRLEWFSHNGHYGPDQDLIAQVLFDLADQETPIQNRIWNALQDARGLSYNERGLDLIEETDQAHEGLALWRTDHKGRKILPIHPEDMNRMMLLPDPVNPGYLYKAGPAETLYGVPVKR